VTQRASQAEVDLLKLILAKHLYLTGKAGFEISIAGRNLVLTYLSEHGNPRNFPTHVGEQVVALLKKQFPALDTDVFFGYVETIRRRQGLHSRYTSFVQSPGSVMFESLDPDNLRRGSLGLDMDDFTKKPTAELPRMYTFVRLEPEPAKRLIFLTEMKVGDLRPDEMIIQYDISPEERAMVESGKSFAEIAASPDPEVHVARNMRIHNGDPNRLIPVKDLAEHVQKTLEGLLAVAAKVTAAVAKNGFGLTPVGGMSASTTDTMLGPIEIKVPPDMSAVSAIRRGETRDGELTVVRSAVEIEVQNGKPAVVTPTDEMVKATGLADDVIDADFRPLVLTFASQLEALAAKVVK
jgi:hypothetical protein